MIFVDTSVWIHYFRGNDPKLVQRLNALLDEDKVALSALVRLELLSGASRNEMLRLKRLFSALPIYYCTSETWNLADRWIEKAPTKGHRFAVADLLIAATASENASSIWSLDQDFKRLAKLGFVEWSN